MFSKIICLLGFAAIARAGLLAAPLLHAAPAVDYYAYPKYEYKYGVADPHTGDHKSQYEVRDGDVVKGQYTVAEPDGTLRIVDYTSDSHNGFNAVVRREGHAIHPQPIAKAYLSAPIIAKPLIAAPLSLGYGHDHY
ncbi:cuticle protein 19-like [Agrilus planipennis]|uniref:Cuticle protein 19-like n=1 Tax=Agrilus planipennis TaxID=224129 RepID=A0A1W4WQB0_AGRPL|nr:cuticle protein 19-like [Agrilus planipennis]